MAVTDVIDGMIPIDDAARDGTPCLVNAGPEFAAAYWTGSMWAYRRHSDEAAIEQIDFEPTHYRKQDVKAPLFRRFGLYDVEPGEE